MEERPPHEVFESLEEKAETLVQTEAIAPPAEAAEVGQVSPGMGVGGYDHDEAMPRVADPAHAQVPSEDLPGDVVANRDVRPDAGFSQVSVEGRTQAGFA